MSDTPKLPSDFSDLEDLTEVWALDGMAALNRARLTHSMEEIDRFYDRMVGRMGTIMAHLQDLLATSPLLEHDRNLYNLACAYMEVAPAVELFRDPDVPDGYPADRFLILD
jgi:hypothetical protein